MIDVIFNADDFGLTPRVTEAIVESFERGVVRSTSALVCHGSPDAIRAADPRVRGFIGLHLQLTDGMPCLPAKRVPSLVGDDGRFPRTANGMGNHDPKEVGAEWHAQLARLRDLGVEPSHLDSHHHVHHREDVLSVFVELARSLNVPARSGPPSVRCALRTARVACPAVCDTSWFRPRMDIRQLLLTLRKNAVRFRGAPIEIMCHAGYADDELRAASTMVEQREAELALLCSPELSRNLQEAGYRSVPMAALRRA